MCNEWDFGKCLSSNLKNDFAALVLTGWENGGLNWWKWCFRFYSKDEDAIPFLDILTKCNTDKIWMDIYYKPPDTHRCLLFSSNHPKYCKKNITFTLAHCTYTIVENTEAKMKHLENLKMNLSKYQ